MFVDRDRDKDKAANKIETLIGERCIINGSLNGEGLLKIDGTIEGNITWEDDIILGSSSTCSGNISCKDAVINGRVNGNVACENLLTIENLGKISGDITVKNLIVKEGGILDGKCTMVVSEKSDEVIE